ncbi:MAG: DUF1501 domain-containing protein, partial [Planctomycetes bacterium]|nr:DUF1501 domain-containing protein [Planctomycetota bacterium]
MQDISLVLKQKFDTFQGHGDFRRWAFGVARFEVLAWRRDKARDRLVLTKADELCVLTAMHTDAQAHETAVPMFHTGNALRARPSIGAWVLYGLGAETENLPGFIAMNPLNRFGGNSHGSAFLPASYQATLVRPGGKERGDPVANVKPSHLSAPQQRLPTDPPKLEPLLTLRSRHETGYPGL